jgi:prepilin-type N-terminal cleavage/methylation domain-containing protein
MNQMNKMIKISRWPNRLCGRSRHRARFAESGMSLIELMIAMTVLTVGMLGSMVMILTGMQSNTRNKTDSAAIVLDQEILEKFATLKLYPAPGFVTIYDCAPSAGGANAHNASLAQGPSPNGSGATLYTTATAPLASNVGDIDWTQPTPTLATSAVQGYAMRYQTCSGDVYEVRWNIMQGGPTPPPNGTSRISLLTVSSRQTSAQGSGNAMLFSRPTTLRTLIED